MILRLTCIKLNTRHSTSSFELAVVNCVCTAEEGFRAETYCISSFCLLCLCSKRRLLNV